MDDLPLGRHAAPEVRVFALRGATQAAENASEAILGATEELLRELISRNGLAPEEMISAIFTVTADLDADFPAVAARRIGLNEVPLMCSREIPVPGSMERVIRVLVHYHAPAGHRPSHVYLGETGKLRSDLTGAQ